MVAASKLAVDYTPDKAHSNNLPPWDMAKAFAFHVCIDKVMDVTGTSSMKLLGQSKNEFIGKHVVNASSRRPTERAVRAAIVRCKGKNWYPGQPREKGGGR